MLCRLFDSGRCSVDELAKLVQLKPLYIEKLAKSDMVRVDSETRLRIGKVLSAFHRAFPETKPPSEYEFEKHRKLKLVTDINGAIARAGTPRGVFEEDDAPPGVRIFKSIDSQGVRRERREVLATDVTRAIARRILRGLEMYLDQVDPVVEAVHTGDT